MIIELGHSVPKGGGAGLKQLFLGADEAGMLVICTGWRVFVQL